MSSILVITFLLILVIILTILFCIMFKICKNTFREKLSNIEKFKNVSKQIDGTLIDCIIFRYDIFDTDRDSYGHSHADIKSEFLYFPIVKYLDENAHYKLITCKTIPNFGYFGMSIFNYNDIGKSIIINIDDKKIQDIDIDLINGYFMGENYTQIKLGNNEEARKGVYNINEKNISKHKIGDIIGAQIYSLNNEQNLLEYISNIKVAPGIAVELNGENLVKRSIKNFKILIILLIIIFSIFTILPNIMFKQYF